ncbi:Ig-like domain-containing protein [Rhizobiaceae bacterium n13]|uniref:Ig-like domain-containing protein n=1 Tax=Ferirhizobium litorale TaxID=2927786 RepID=A0AAE3U4G2_9HYPH|nr:Ig-like domain-containing protein [Fererhizobium litorale]MDI7863272.1 Ig-like domain-containing protein [Fererhizobium litorale]MDI7922994.1 Ig-like domain-containing protein [Fererhizobium litorale]
MPTLSNGSELTVWEDVNNQSPDAVLFDIRETDGDVLGPTGAHSDYPYGSVDIASVDVFDGFFTVTTFTNDGRTQLFTNVETMVFDNEGNYIRTLSAQAAYLSTRILAINAASPNDITITYQGANEYFGGQNTQYGQHQIILENGALKPDTFVNHAPTVADMKFTLAPGQSLDDIKFSAADADFDLLSFVIVDGPDHGTVEQETRFEAGYYPFPQGQYGGSLHYHQSFLKGNLFDYTPAAGFTGTDTFTVYATDGQGNSEVATITITVAPPAEHIDLTDRKDWVNYKPSDHAVFVAALGGNDHVVGSQFNDFLDGGAGKDILRGGMGDDEIAGGAANDFLHGGAGNDVVNGGAGRDLLLGGTGEDTFVFDLEPGRGDADRILDFRSSHDTIALDSAVFAGMAPGALDADTFVRGKAALDADDRIIYHKASGYLFFDADGSGGEDAVVFASLSPGTSLDVDDFRFF